MNPSLDSQRAEASCSPGDITVTRVPAGYLIGRALEPIGHGPWWEYIATVTPLDVAKHQARTIARQNGVRAWLHRNGDDYDLIQPEE